MDCVAQHVTGLLSFDDSLFFNGKDVCVIYGELEVEEMADREARKGFQKWMGREKVNTFLSVKRFTYSGQP